MKKKTHEEYVKELKIKNPNMLVIGQYVNANTKILHKCLIHNVCWMNTPSRMLQGVGCEKCHAERISTSKTRTHEEYVEQLKRVTSDIIPMEQFKTCTTGILHYCKKHNVTWNAIPDNVLKGCGCKECGKEKIGLKNSMPFDKYKKELQSKFPNIECIGEYTNQTNPVLHRCKKCDYEWLSRPIYVLNSSGCKKCTGHLRRTSQEYRDELQEIHPNIEVISEFVNTSTPITHKCMIHNYYWDVVPSSILSGTGCPICGREKTSLSLRKSHEEYMEELKNINPNIICIDKYTDSTRKIKVKCLKCNTTWDALPFNLLQGHGCPTCNISFGENKIREWLISHDIDFISQKRFVDCKDKRTLPFDFYIPSENKAIEYDGEQHTKPINWFGGDEGLQYRIKHDEIKNKYCIDNNISLLRISYNDDIESKLNSFFI